MKQIGIAELKSRLSEFLRLVQTGESIAVMDRNREIAQIVPVVERPGIRIRKPEAGSSKPGRMSIPKSSRPHVDIFELLLEERQNNR